MRFTERKTLTVPAEFKADTAKRQITGYASVFGNVDGNDDIVLKGAYTRTLENDLPAGRIKVKRNHQYLIGKPIHAEQDSKGLLTVSQLSDTDLGNETLVLVQDGVIDEMSIGFRTEEKGYTTVEGRRVREIKAAKLYEWSFMDDKAANDLAQVVQVKSLADVSMVLYQMQDALAALRTLSYTPPEIAERLTALIADMQDVAAAVEPNDADDDAEAADALSGLLTAFRSTLTPSRSA